MNTRCDNLDRLTKEFEAAGVSFTRMNRRDFETMEGIMNGKNCLLWLTDHSKLAPIYINDSGKRYFGLSENNLRGQGFEWLLNLSHRDDLHILQGAIGQLNLKPRDTIRVSIRMKNHEGKWRWVYTSQKALTLDRTGIPQYMVVQAYDIEDLVENQPAKNNGIDYMEKLKLYNTLTDREKEILNLVAEEKTSQEIADELFIETSTVHTHRKHIIKKLNVKTSLGLVQYALFFAETP